MLSYHVAASYLLIFEGETNGKQNTVLLLGFDKVLHACSFVIGLFYAVHS